LSHLIKRLFRERDVLKAIICFKCTELIGALHHQQIKLEQLEANDLKIVGYKERDALLCHKCNEILRPKELYFENQNDYDRFIQNALCKIAEKISEDIGYCDNCDGYQFQRHIHNVNHGEEQELIREDKYGTYIAELLEDSCIPEHVIDDILKYLVCKKCSASESYKEARNFEQWDRVYSDFEWDNFWGGRIVKFADNYDISISEYELRSFQEYLLKRPMIALKHNVGEKIFDALQKCFDAQDFCYLKPEVVLHRGRSRYRDNPKYNLEKLWCPPTGLSSQGRYNAIGVSVLYCCDKKDAIPYELHTTQGQVIDVITIKVNKSLKVFDMDSAFESFEGFISAPNLESKAVKQEYLLTNFIGACCEAIGFNGIKYNGVGDSNSEYMNYALFNMKMNEQIILQDRIESVNYSVAYKNSRASLYENVDTKIRWLTT
jgi:hypothetical protein